MNNREIKFRAWDKEEEVMLYNIEEAYDGGWGKVKEGRGGDKYYYRWSSFGRVLQDEQVVLMQYTGLKDKNDKEIYEGDIVHMRSLPKRMLNRDYKAVVKFKDGLLLPFYDYTRDGRPIDLCEDVEVIGNKFEDSKLLNSANGNGN